MGPETREFGATRNPGPILWVSPGPETRHPEGGTRDPRPGIQLVGGTLDLRPRTLKVGPNTRDQGRLFYMGPKTRDPGH